MKKFHFQMEKLLTYKDQVLGGQMMVLAELNSQLTEVQNRKTELQNKIAEEQRDFEQKILKASTPVIWQLHDVFVESMKEKIKLKDLEIFHIQQSIDKQRDIIKQTKIETRSLEIIKDARWQDYKKEEQKKTEQEIEEFVSAQGVLKEISK